MIFWKDFIFDQELGPLLSPDLFDEVENSAISFFPNSNEVLHPQNTPPLETHDSGIKT